MRSLISLLFIVSCLVIFSDCWPSSFGQGNFYPTNGVYDPKISESKTSVAIRDVIKRNSPRFRKVLVRNSNPDIVFSNADARMMTSRAKTKLDTLAGFVRDRFSTRLYVIKAWTDNVNIRDLSLHYEGRAVLVKLESNSRHLLDDVMIQALEAGFDWVWYKNHDSVHLSVIPDVCQSKLDLAIVVDSSGSVGYSNFKKVRDFLIKLIEYFNVGRDETRISVINYSNYVNVVFRLDQYFNKHEMKNQIRYMNYINSNTATGDALITMVNHVFQTHKGMRDDKSIPKIGILMTDGYSNSGKTVGYAAQKVRDHGVSMFVIGVKNGVSMAEVNQVASPPVSDHYFHIATFNDLSKFVDKISTVSCDEGSALSQCDNAETSIDGGSFKYFKAKFAGRSRTVSVEIADKRGKSFLYTSLTLRNPGPLSDASAVQKSESQMSPRTVSVYLNIHSETLLYIAVQGQEDNNVFDLSIWDSLFSQPKITKSVNEDVSVGTIISTFQTKVNPTSFHYRIRGGSRSSDFSIDPRSGVVKVARPLDRETVASYQFSVVAIDQSDKCHKGLMSLVINVIDANDNKPKFERSVYQASLREDTPTRQYVIQVKATDKDAGRNGELTYELVGTNSNLLTINSRTGEIRTKKSFDYEVRSYYEVQLRVHDNGSPQQSDTATLKLSITDVNEKPHFTNCATARSCAFTLDENKPKSTTVGSRLTAQDPDTKQNCALKFFVTSLDRQYFDIDSSGQIHTKSVLDREVKETYSLDIRVVDCGKPALHAQTTVIVRLNDLNDNRPVFSGAPYECRVPEGPANAVVCSVHATDKDKGVNAQIDYTITKTSLNGALSIDASGRMTLRKQLDRETQDTVVLEVTAKDRGNPTLSAVATVKIIVLDINDNKPQFQGSSAFSIDENVNIGTKVTKLQATDRDLGLNGMVRFSIESGNAGNTFLVNSNGELVTRRSPDRETRDKYSLTIKAQDLGSPVLSNTKTFTININDLNDNRPMFKQGRYSESVKENAAMDTLVVKVEASDADIGINKQFVYSIANGDKQNQFSINQQGEIKVVGKLDFSKIDFYRLTIEATDKGSPTLKGQTIVDIRVIDTNDHTPRFINTPYIKELVENVPRGTNVLQVKATDDDTGASGELRFTLSSTTLPFSIDPTTGWITTQREIDYEKQTKYSFKVTAEDQGALPHLKATVDVVVNIKDLNDNRPQLADFTIEVKEDEITGRTLKEVKGTDADSGANGDLEYTLLTTNTPFEVIRTFLKLKTKLDREKVDRYTLKVKVADKGFPSLSTECTITVKVLDVNDNDPRVKDKVCSVKENARQGTRVCFLEGTDADIGDNARLTYLPVSDKFTVDPNTGEIKTKVVFDREKIDKFSLTAKVKDNGSPHRESTANLVINIADENDNYPVFTESAYAFSFVEEQADGTRVGEVHATDADQGSNGEVVYTIIGTNLFSIEKDASSGKGVLKAKRLDRETRGRHKFTVRASDRGSPSLSKDVPLVVTVTDINDNKPLMMSKTVTSKVKETVAVGTYVVKVSATDKDMGNNAKITYSIKSGVNSDHFTINANTGEVTTAKVLDYETIPSYGLVVQSKDGGSPSLTDTADLSIIVENEDDTAPQFEKVKEVSLREDVAINHPVIKFKATDADGSTLTFSIEGGNSEDKFVINSASGLLTVKKRLDRETTDRYNISVRVSDGARSQLSYLPVKVLDVNDNEPVFDKDPYTATTEEESKDLTRLVVRVHATDIDLGLNAEIVYAITSGNTNDAFKIAPQTGKILANRPLDREKIETYNLKVTASDKGTPIRKTSVPVTITLSDINDNTPIFDKDPYLVSIPENSGAGAKIVGVKATDVDKDENGKVHYIIVSDPHSAFTIDKDTGEIVSAVDFDREQLDAYTITVRALDKGTPTKSSTAEVKVTVTDVNDEIPVISSASIPAINESAEVGRKIVQIQASDKDIGVNQQLTYKLEDTDKLRISDKGEIFLKEKLDRETADKFTAKVIVADKGTPSLHAVKIFEVEVLDANDNVPVFTGTFKGLMDENQSTRASLFTASATDADLGANAKITYSVLDTHGGVFEIHPSTAEVFSVKPVDYEKVTSFDVTVRASDWKYHTDTVAVVTVNNLNDNKPTFQHDKHTIEVEENTKRGTVVLTVKATDIDPFGKLVYAIKGSGVPFSVDSRSGVVRVSGDLDRETKDKYSFKITATDQGEPVQLSAETDITIKITDVNDNAPQFANYANTVQIMENNKLGITLSEMKATDRDIGENAEIRYELSTQSPYCDVDLKTGKVTAKVSFDRESVKSALTCQYHAYDLGHPKLKSPVRTLTLEIRDENDNHPVWSKTSLISVPENEPINSTVVFVEAFDQDQGRNAEISYYVKDGEDFHIDESTGAVSVKRALDRETKDHYTVTLVARDNGLTKRLESETTIDIKITDINDNAPVFDKDRLEGSVFENDKNVPFSLVKVDATDRDLGINAEIEYSLESGGDLFRIDGQSGLIELLRSLDREEQDIYKLNVTAKDKGTPSLHSTAVVTITVKDMDDNCPEFDLPLYEATVDENLAYGTTILKVSATDKDIGDYGKLNYGILKSNDRGAFTIHPKTGVISVGNPTKVDREYAAKYFLTVRAGSQVCGQTDEDTNIGEGGNPTANNYTTANVIISVRDVNDNAPRVINARENIAYTNYALKKLLWLNVTDGDLGKGGEVNYKLLYTKEHLVGGNIEHHVVVEVSDNGAPALSSNHTIVVVNNINCNAMHLSLDSFGNLMVDSLCTVLNLDKQRKLLVGQRLRLVCNATANSDVRYRWSRDGDLVTSWSTNGVFSIQNVQQSDEASYSCLASSSAGLLQSTATKVIVYEKPRIVEQPVALSVNEKESATFSVKVIADPAPTYQWFKDDQPIKDATSATFTLEETIFADKALYHCRVSNSEGSVDSEKIRLLVVERSKIVTITVKLKKNEKKTCFDFFPEDFERISSTILNKTVLVTKFTAEQAVKICKRTACSKNPCQNKGTCEVTSDGFKCLCTPEWQGDVCAENRDECAQGDMCRGNSTCQDTKGSFTCECASDLTGKRCQYRAKVCENKCDVTKEVCVPREINEGVRGASEYKCLKKSNTLTIVTKVDKGWNKNKKFDLESLLNRIIKTTRQKSQTSRRRRDIESDTTTSRKRRDVSDTTTQAVDFGMCTAHITNHEIEGDEAKVSFILDCSDAKNVTNKTIQFTNDVIRQLCSQLFQGDEITACGRDHLIKPPQTKVVTTTTKVQVVVKDNNGKTLTTDETLKTIEEKGLKGNSGEFEIIDSKIAFKVEEGNNNNNTTTIIIAVVACLAVLTIVVVAVVVVRRRRNKEVVTSSSVMHQRAQMMQSDASTSHLVTNSPYNAGRENLAYSASNTGHEGDGETFMFEMQPGGLVSK